MFVMQLGREEAEMEIGREYVRLYEDILYCTDSKGTRP